MLTIESVLRISWGLWTTVASSRKVRFTSMSRPKVGPVAMRNPAYDPDGIRVLKAVNRPELKHSTNFGARSEPDRMGGRDLDSDTYFVIFDPLLIPARRAVNATVTVKTDADNP
ncbi:RNA-dependent RNA polymerase [Mycena sanguinolenta]|uniref:RNA-dependent RNA polymerase n=1 Tax=Mycena sanguinolenta TaxID=230812 RepID=A0A8H7CPG5_9AGAR|nr:RNA-dependent RNA polymerase [Mycena sanguinolenta]